MRAEEWTDLVHALMFPGKTIIVYMAFAKLTAFLGQMHAVWAWQHACANGYDASELPEVLRAASAARSRMPEVLEVPPLPRGHIAGGKGGPFRRGKAPSDSTTCE